VGHLPQDFATGQIVPEGKVNKKKAYALFERHFSPRAKIA
jgi:hypothetical protein